MQKLIFILFCYKIVTTLIEMASHFGCIFVVSLLGIMFAVFIGIGSSKIAQSVKVCSDTTKATVYSTNTSIPLIGIRATDCECSSASNLPSCDYVYETKNANNDIKCASNDFICKKKKNFICTVGNYQNVSMIYQLIFIYTNGSLLNLTIPLQCTITSPGWCSNHYTGQTVQIKIDVQNPSAFQIKSCDTEFDMGITFLIFGCFPIIVVITVSIIFGTAKLLSYCWNGCGYLTSKCKSLMKTKKRTITLQACSSPV